MEIFVILYVLFFHWFADFLLQTPEQSKLKSKSIKVLLTHTFVYSYVMCAAIQVLIGFNVFGAQSELASVYFFISMFITHTLIDFISSRITTKQHETNNMTHFFDVIGFDQFLHFLTIFVSLKVILL